eukprot:scaffold24845_cov89-Phaeocystis_antarctica.AAC.2
MILLNTEIDRECLDRARPRRPRRLCGLVGSIVVRATFSPTAAAQQQQLVASAARLRDPRICAGPDMSDTERKFSRTRLSTFD